MASMAAPVDGDQDRGPSLMAMFWAESAIAFVVISLRVTGRIMIRKLGLDDYMMLFTLVGDPWPTYRSRYHSDSPSFFS